MARKEKGGLLQLSGAICSRRYRCRHCYPFLRFAPAFVGREPIPFALVAVLPQRRSARFPVQLRGSARCPFAPRRKKIRAISDPSPFFVRSCPGASVFLSFPGASLCPLLSSLRGPIFVPEPGADEAVSGSGLRLRSYQTFSCPGCTMLAP